MSTQWVNQICHLTLFQIFATVNVFDPCDPYVTFDPKQSITFNPFNKPMLVTKFGWNPIKYVEEEANCQKEERNGKIKVS